MDYLLHGPNLAYLLMMRGYLKDSAELIKLLAGQAKDKATHVEVLLTQDAAYTKTYQKTL